MSLIELYIAERLQWLCRACVLPRLNVCNDAKVENQP